MKTLFCIFFPTFFSVFAVVYVLLVVPRRLGQGEKRAGMDWNSCKVETRGRRRAPIEGRMTTGEIWGPPLASPPTEPAFRAEKAGDKGMEIQITRSRGHRPQVPPSLRLRLRPTSSTSLRTWKQLITSQGRGEEPRQANVVDGTRR